MPTTLRLEGLRELQTALRHLPEELTGEASAIVTAHAEDASRKIQTAYPEGPTGNLKRGVVVERGQISSRFGSAAIVRSRARHAWLYEHGATKRGVNTTTKTPKAMIPIVIRVRAQMVRALIQLVRKAGFEVDA